MKFDLIKYNDFCQVNVNEADMFSIKQKCVFLNLAPLIKMKQFN